MTYTILTWDCETDGWEPYVTGLSLFGLRPALRSLRGKRRSWSDDTIKVWREDLSLEDYDRDDARAARQLAIESETETEQYPLFALNGESL